MDNVKFLALMGDDSIDFNVLVTKDNLMAFADYIVDRTRKEFADKSAQAERQKRDEQTLLTRKETCEYLGVCETTLWKWARPDVRYLVPVKVGTKVRYRKSDLDRIKFGQAKENRRK